MPQVPLVSPDGAEIRARRLDLGLTPAQLAARIPGNRHPQTIRRIEAGRITRVSEILLHQIARALQAPAKDITRRGKACDMSTSREDDQPGTAA